MGPFAGLANTVEDMILTIGGKGELLIVLLQSQWGWDRAGYNPVDLFYLNHRGIQ